MSNRKFHLVAYIVLTLVSCKNIETKNLKTEN